MCRLKTPSPYPSRGKGVVTYFLCMLFMLVCLCPYLSPLYALPSGRDWEGGHYYRSVEGLKKAELKAALHDLIQPNLVLSYGGKGEGYTWAGFYAADWLEGGYVRDRYSNEQRRFNEDKSAVSNMNIEHIWANSWWGHLMNNAYCDLFNLYPADAPANGRKSNNPIGVVDGAVAYDNGVTKVGKSSSFRADTLITAWEPADQWKGDFARTYFYMATCYSHMRNLWTTTEGWLTVDGSDWPTMRPWVYELMLQWAKQDPVDQIEKDRNEVIYGIQGNRNPFVDYPQLADYIWGDSTEEQFYVDPTSMEMELFVPEAKVRFDYGLQALSKGLDTMLVIRGRNIPNGLTLAVNNPVFELGTTQVSAEQLVEGYAVPLHVKPETAGRYEAVLTISGDAILLTDTLSVSFVDGIPAYEATDIVCTPYVRRFTANWMNYEPGAEYTLDVYTKGNDGSHKPFKTFTTQDTYYQVSGLQAKTLYYYTVSIYEDGVLKASSNEVAVQMPEVKPVFSVSPSAISFTTVPGEPSRETEVTVTALAVPEYVTQVSLDAPFEVSFDGEEWGQTLTLTGSEPVFLVRMGAVAEEGEYEGEMLLNTKGVEEKVVTLTASVSASKAFFEDFETGSKNGYAEATVTCTAAKWRMTDAYPVGDDNRNGTRSVRLRNKGSIEMQEDKANGCDSLWFYAGHYGKDTGVRLSVYYSIDGGENWTVVAENIEMGDWQRYGYKLDVKSDIRLRFVNNGSTNTKRSNLDDVQMSSYSNADGINEIVEGQRSNAIYDLNGRRATNQQHVIIRSNKKIIER